MAAGSGPLLLFYHGLPLIWVSFHHQMTALKDEFRVVAVDGTGVNLSSKPTSLEPYRLPNLARQLDQLAQHLAGSDTDVRRARLAIETHLTRIALHRPLDEIPDAGQKADAEDVRTWFREVFLDAIVD